MGEKILLSKVPIVAGREASTDFHVDLHSVSRKHACISKTDEGYLLEDLNSSNGTFINEVRLSKPGILSNGDNIALGPDFEMRAVIVPLMEAKSSEPTNSEATAFFQSGAKQAKGDATAFMSGPAKSDQTIAFTAMPPVPVIPPRVVINESGQEPRIVTLTKDRVKIGR